MSRCVRTVLIDSANIIYVCMTLAGGSPYLASKINEAKDYLDKHKPQG